MTNPHPEPCPKCWGNGHILRRGIPPAVCTKCHGTCQVAYKQPAEKRTRTRVRAKERKAEKLRAAVEKFREDYPEVWLWCCTAEMEFAGKMRAAVERWGGMTENQLAASLRCCRGRYARRGLI